VKATYASIYVIVRDSRSARRCQTIQRTILNDRVGCQLDNLHVLYKVIVIPRETDRVTLVPTGTDVWLADETQAVAAVVADLPGPEGDRIAVAVG
jgi:hypothetical protein